VSVHSGFRVHEEPGRRTKEAAANINRAGCGSIAGENSGLRRLFPGALLHLQHQLGSGERDGHAVDNLGLDPAVGVFKTDPAGFGHQVDDDVVVYQDHNPPRDVFATELTDRAIWQDLEGPFDEGLIRRSRAMSKSMSSVARTKPRRLIANPPTTT